MKAVIYDIAGIGIGPFNLGFAALAAPIGQLDCIFFDGKPCFSWHPGLMLNFAKLQVPFYADLVTGADPSSRFGFLNFMKRTGRLYQFAILEDNYITRREYNDYCFWVASQIPTLRFNHLVTGIRYDGQKEVYELTVMCDGVESVFLARRLVVGTGSQPFLPGPLKIEKSNNFFHSADYLFHKKNLLDKTSVTLIGSGQSAAEIFYDLLQQEDSSIKRLDWITRSERLCAMDISKFSLEMASPDYIEYFHGLPSAQKKQILGRQDLLYKGINQELLTEIYKMLYYAKNGPTDICLRPNCELKAVEKIEEGYSMQLYHREVQKDFHHFSNAVVLATGYHRPVPTIMEQIHDRLRWEPDGNFKVAKNYSIDQKGDSIFVQNADLHSHGFNAPDLGMGPYRNAVILNAILGYDHFMVESKVAFQSFGI